MSVKMKFINISGPRDDIDRVMDLYLSRYEIQLESALTELKTVENLRPFVEINPYRDALLKAQQYVSYLNEPEKIAPDTSMGLDDIFELIRATNEEYLTFQARKDVLKRKQDELQAKTQQLLEKVQNGNNTKEIVDQLKQNETLLEWGNKILTWVINNL